MARLPTPGQDSGTWGTVLNDFLTQAHTSSGALLPSAVDSAVSDATASATGVVQLAGDLGGTAAAPTIANGVITSAKIANATITDANISTTAAIAQSKIANLTSNLSSKLSAANNLSDVASTATARTNLSVAQAAGFAKMTVGTAAPTSPAVGDIWIDTN
jgi:hypothetical protein